MYHPLGIFSITQKIFEISALFLSNFSQNRFRHLMKKYKAIGLTQAFLWPFFHLAFGKGLRYILPPMASIYKRFLSQEIQDDEQQLKKKQLSIALSGAEIFRVVHIPSLTPCAIHNNHQAVLEGLRIHLTVQCLKFKNKKIEFPSFIAIILTLIVRGQNFAECILSSNLTR